MAKKNWINVKVDMRQNENGMHEVYIDGERAELEIEYEMIQILRKAGKI